MIVDYSVNKLQPVNWAHPLNRGLVSWWLTMPGWNFGSTWRELCGRYHGTLTNMDPATDWLSAAGLPGAFGSLEFDGSNDHVNCGNIGAALPITVIVRFKSGTGNPFFAEYRNAGNNGWVFTGLNFGTSGSLRFTFGGIAVYDLGSGTTMTAGTWNFAAVTVTGNGGTATGYHSIAPLGRLYSASATVGTMSGTPTTLGVGGSIVFPGSAAVCSLAECRVYNRALSSDEIQAAHVDAYLGYPGTLNRVDRRARRYVAGGAPATGDPMLLFT